MRDRWSHEIDQLSEAFEQEFSKLSADELNWKPNAQTWSVGQIIQHLIIVNESYYPLLSQIRKQTYYVPRFGRIGIVNRFFGKIVLDAVRPDQKRKTKTLTIWEPSLSQVRSDIVSQFIRHQQELKRVIVESGDLVDSGTVISSPANRIIVYKLETAFDIMIAHEKRHLQQACSINQMRVSKPAR